MLSAIRIRCEELVSRLLGESGCEASERRLRRASSVGDRRGVNSSRETVDDPEGTDKEKEEGLWL